MSDHGVDVPALVPMLSRGKHRSPRKGACFMELASFVAGERWSDHPACTHPLLAAVARYVNDYTSAAGRSRLVALVPSVIGLTSDDMRVDVRIALRAATVALPVVSADRQRAMAVSVLAAERVLAEFDGRLAGGLEERSRRALARAPHAAQWAERHVHGVRVTPKAFRRHAAPSTVRCAAEGIASACVLEPDEILRDLLTGAIDECAAWVRADRGGTFDAPTWAAACQLTGVRG